MLAMVAILQFNLCKRLLSSHVHKGSARHFEPGGWLGRGPMKAETSCTIGTEPSITLMKNLTKPAVLAAFILFHFNSAYATSIGVNFLGDGSGETTLAPADSAGVVAQTNWNNIISLPYVGISSPLYDSAGGFTVVQLQYAGNDAWNADGLTDTPNDRLMKGILKEGKTSLLRPSNMFSGLISR